MLRISLTLALAFCTYISIAQDSKRLSGKVIDEQTGDPLAFAHVGIFNSSYGTITNIEGEFSILIPLTYEDKMLSTSYLGYELKSLPIASLSLNKELIIRLKAAVTELPELVISTKQKTIMEEAIEAIPRNHDQQEMKLRAFWRASIWNELSEYVQMTEYAFDMYRVGDIDKEKNKMKILRGRVARDTSFFEDIGGMQIGVTPPTLFVNSLLKEHALINKKVIKKHNYKITDASTYNDRAVYVVSFQPKEKAKGSLFEGTILLDTETLAFVKISYRKLIDPDDPDKVFGGMSLASMLVGLGGSTLDSFENELNYQFVDGKWYLSHAKYDINWTMRRSKAGVIKPVTFKADFVVTDIQKENIVLPPEDELASKDILVRQKTKNEDDFWGKFNYLKADNNFEEVFSEILSRGKAPDSSMETE